MHSKEIKQLLRLQNEPCISVSDLEAHDILIANSIEFMDELKQSYIDWGDGEKWVYVPKKKIIYTPDIKGDFRVMPCITDFKDGIKAVKVIGTNEENRTIKDKISVGKMLLIDWYDNYVYATIDACVLSSFRTAAISLLAYSLIYKENNSVGLLGLGRIGFYTAILLHRWLGVTQVNCYDPNSVISEKFEKLVSFYAPDLSISLLDSEDTISQSSSLFLATDSETSILNSNNSSHLKFVSSVGADANNLSELDETLIDKFEIITDSIQSMLLGDMKIWKEKELLSEENVTELKDIMNSMVSIEKNTLFISTGIAVQDALIGQFIINKFSHKI
ncbi:hypothetical protein [Sulfurimonas sp.]|uniref:hypothetical protein n=1 Tax=Sulfurimonas sp. TaxID=2022749 RepID=UPI0035625844